MLSDIGSLYSKITNLCCSSIETEKGSFSGKGVNSKEKELKEAQINKLAMEALQKLLAGEDPGPLTDEVKTRVDAGLIEFYIRRLAVHVALSPATNFEEAEKVAAAALEAFAKNFAEAVDNQTGQTQEEIKENIKEALGIDSKNLALYGLTFRHQLQQQQLAEEAKKQQG